MHQHMQAWYPPHYFVLPHLMAKAKLALQF